VYILQYEISAPKKTHEISSKSIEDGLDVNIQHLLQEKDIINPVNEGPSAINHRSLGYTACCTAFISGRKRALAITDRRSSLFGSISLARLVPSTRSIHQGSSITQHRYCQLALRFHLFSG
jgi:hypothetical protein